MNSEENKTDYQKLPRGDGRKSLKALIESGQQLEHYIGFEISGMVHLGTGLVSMGKIADFLEAGAKCRVLLADFHTFWIRN